MRSGGGPAPHRIDNGPDSSTNCGQGEHDHNAGHGSGWSTNGWSRRGQKAIVRLAEKFPNVVMVHTAVHASWLDQVSVNRPWTSGLARVV